MLLFVYVPNRHGIKAVINLQTKGEHAHCGLGLEPGGFSYDQEEFMENDSKGLPSVSYY